MITRENSRREVLERAAFTLMEILIVVAIIVALAGVGGYFLIGQLNQSKETTARIQAKKIAEACEMYFMRTGQKEFPRDVNQLIAQMPDGNGPVMKDARAIIDPWGQPYQIQQGPTGPIVISTGSGKQLSSAD